MPPPSPRSRRLRLPRVRPQPSDTGFSRRGFLAASGLGAAGALALGSTSAEAATQLTFADAGYTGDTLVVLSFRGGFDGLTAVAPVGDAAYYEARPNIAVPQSRGLKLDARFALHPALAPLLPLFTSGRLAMVHAVGQPNPTRSHFTDMDEMERAAPGLLPADGLAGPHGRRDHDPRSLRRDLARVDQRPALPHGPHGRARHAQPGQLRPRRRVGRHRDEPVDQGARALYAGAPAQLAGPASTALSTVGTTTALTSTPYTPAGGAAYPYGALGDALRDAARLIKAGVGLRAVTIDSGNWDMHVNLGRSDGGWMYNQLTEVGKALAAFNTDLGAAATRSPS